MDDFKIDEDRFIKNLQDVGIDKETLKIALKYYKEKNKIKELQLLTKERYILLEKIHDLENQMNCLDYLIFELNK